jgi:hypothetical protein
VRVVCWHVGDRVPAPDRASDRDGALANNAGTDPEILAGDVGSHQLAKTGLGEAEPSGPALPGSRDRPAETSGGIMRISVFPMGVDLEERRHLLPATGHSVRQVSPISLRRAEMRACSSLRKTAN